MPITKAMRAERRARAEKAQSEWQALGPAKQLEMLDNRIGKNKGAKRQRARLQKALR